MPRKKTIEFEDMTLRQIKAYTDIHKSEGLRAGSVCFDAATYCGKNYADYQRDRIVKTFFPSLDHSLIETSNNK